MKEQKGREATMKCGILYFLVRKSEGILISDFCGNHGKCFILTGIGIPHCRSIIGMQWLDAVSKMATFFRFSEVLKRYLEEKKKKTRAFPVSCI